jgi:Purine nucleoside phosphorylase
MKKALEASQIILDRTNFDGDTAVVLGSGLGGFTDALIDSELIQYSDIPHYPRSTVEGHSGEMVIGKLMNKEIIIAKGRMHPYEGIF